MLYQALDFQPDLKINPTRRGRQPLIVIKELVADIRFLYSSFSFCIRSSASCTSMSGSLACTASLELDSSEPMAVLVSMLASAPLPATRLWC